MTRRQISAELRAAFQEVLHLLAVRRRVSEREPRDLLVRDRNVEPVAHALRSSSPSFFCWCATFSPSADLPSPESLHGLGENHGRRALVGHRGRVSGIHFHRIVAAAIQAPDLLVGHVGDHILELGILAEEMLARIRAALGFEVLVLAVHAFFHQALEQALMIALEQGIPARAPQHLDDVPAGAEEGGLQLLDDLAVAAHRPVQALQVAVDDEDEVVELLAHRHGERAHRFRLVHLAVAQKRPDLAIRRRHDPAVLQIAHEARLENRHHGTQSHGHRRELPEIRHQPGMRIGGQAVAAHLLTKAQELPSSSGPSR